MGQHLHRRAHRHGNDKNIALRRCRIQVFYPVHQRHLERGFGIETVILNTYYFIGKMLAAQFYCHRAANKAESYNCYFHITFLILSKASSNTPGSAQSEMRRYSRPFLPKMNPGVMNTPASSSSLSETASASAPLFPQRKSP